MWGSLDHREWESDVGPTNETAATKDLTVAGPLPELPAPIDGRLCLAGPRERTYIRQQIEHAGFEIDDVRTHRDDLLAMRDRLIDILDYERLVDALCDCETQLRDGAKELEAAVEFDRIDYISIVATRRS